MRYKFTIGVMPEEIEALEHQLRSFGVSYMNDSREYRESYYNIEVHIHADDVRQALATTANIQTSLGIRAIGGLQEWDVNRNAWGRWISLDEHH